MARSSTSASPRRATASPARPNAGLLKGKIHYMAPEQALGGVVDRRADVFAVGAILYHLLSGAPPFDGPNQLAVLSGSPRGSRRCRSRRTVPAPVARVVMRALAIAPDARFATAAELQAAIESAMIESRLTCTQAHVAEFVAEHGASRTASRKEAIDLALSAAAERARVRDVLRPNPDKSATGVLASAADFQRRGEVSVGSRPSSILLPSPACRSRLYRPSPSGSIDVVVVDTPSHKGKVVLVAAVLLVVGVAAGAVATFFVASAPRRAAAELGERSLLRNRRRAATSAVALDDLRRRSTSRASIRIRCPPPSSSDGRRQRSRSTSVAPTATSPLRRTARPPRHIEEEQVWVLGSARSASRSSRAWPSQLPRRLNPPPIEETARSLMDQGDDLRNKGDLKARAETLPGRE